MLGFTSSQKLDKNNDIYAYIIFGDSTALGRAEGFNTPQVLKDKYFKIYNWVWIWHAGSLQLLEYDVNNAVASNPGQFGMELQLATTLKVNKQEPILFIKKAVGGSSLAPTTVAGTASSWDKATGGLYNILVSDVTNAITAAQNYNEGYNVYIKGIICMLGLNDCGNDNASGAFSSNMDNLITNLYNDIPLLYSGKTKLYLGRPNIAANVDPTRLNVIRTVIDNAASTYSFVESVNLDGLPLKSDLIHHGTEGELGDVDSVAVRFYNAINI